MRRRIRLTDEQLRRASKMKASGESWVAMERELGVHRQIVKREYLESEKRQVLIDLKNVRQEVAAEDFKEHLELLSALGEEIGRHLEQGSLSRNWLKGDGAIKAVVESSAPMQSEDGDSVQPQHSERFSRQRRWLYEGLTSHVVETSHESDLTEFDRRRKRCSATLAGLEKLAELEIMSHLQGHASDLNWDEHQIGNLRTDVFDLLWRVISEVVAGDWVKEGMSDTQWSEIVKATSNLDGRITVVPETWAIIVQRTVTIPELSGEEEAEAVRAACLNMVEALLFSEQAHQLATELNDVRRRAMDLSDQLDPLRLRPILLRTRCDLCPV